MQLGGDFRKRLCIISTHTHTQTMKATWVILLCEQLVYMQLTKTMSSSFHVHAYMRKRCNHHNFSLIKLV